MIMIYLLEYMATQGLFFFTALGDCMFHLFTKKTNAESNEVPLWGLPRTTVSILPFQKETSEYEPSHLTNEQIQFFNSFLDFPSVESDYKKEVTVDCTNELPMEKELLTMDAWVEEQPKPVSFSSQLAATASSKICDFEVGEQLWVVEVVGEEQGYLHVSDGSGRVWVKATNFNNIGKWDILSMFVERSSDNHVFAKEIAILQKHSKEFSLEDDELIEYSKIVEPTVVTA